MSHNGLVENEMASLVGIDMDGDIVAANDVADTCLDAVEDCLDRSSPTRRLGAELESCRVLQLPVCAFQLANSENEVIHIVDLGVDLVPRRGKDSFDIVEKSGAVAGLGIEKQQKTALNISVDVVV